MAASGETSVSYDRLRALRDQGLLDDRAVARGVALATTSPDAASWCRAIDLYLLVLGSALCLAGVVFFFAFNWAGMHHFAKLGLVAAGVAGSASYAATRGLSRRSGQAALIAATVLVGPFWAVFGQAYQTGADPWNLFALWAARWKDDEEGAGGGALSWGREEAASRSASLRARK